MSKNQKKSKKPIKSSYIENKKGEVIQKNRNEKENVTFQKWIPFLLFAFAFILYLPTVNHDYAFDDSIVITENKFTKKGLEGIPFLVSNDFFAGSTDGSIVNLTGGRYRPLSLVMFAIEYHFFGLNPKVGHFINILFYALSAVLLYKVLTHWFKENILVPILACILFIVHPVHTEVVANIKSRDEIMALFLLLSCMILFQKYLKTYNTKLLIFGSLCFFGSLLSKETSLTFLLLLPLCVWIFEPIEQKKYFLIIGGIFTMSMCYLIIRTVMLGKGLNIEQTDLMENPLYNSSFSERIGTVSVIVLKYWQLLIYPISLSCDYSYNQIPRVTISNLYAIIGIVLHILLLVFVIIKIRKKNIIALCILLIIIPLSPATNLFFNLGAPLGERFLYIPSVGFTILLAYFLSNIYKNPIFQTSKIKLISFLTVLTICVIASGLTIERNKKWENNYTLFSNDSKIVNNSAKIHYYYGNSLLKKFIDLEPEEQKRNFKNYLPKALNEFRKSVKIYPKFHTAWYNIALVHYKIANVNEGTTLATDEANKAIKALQTTLNLEQNHIISLELAAEIYSRYLNQPDKTIYYCNKLINEANIKTGNIYSTLGIAYFLKGNINFAFNAMNQAVLIEPKNPQMWINLGSLYGNSGNTQKAEECFQKASSLK